MKKLILFIASLSLFACNNGEENLSTFNGRLDVDIIRISAKTSGEIDSLFIDEGQTVIKSQSLAVIETDRLKLQMEQQDAQLAELNANARALDAQAKQIKAQIKLNKDLLTKTTDLVKNGAATSQKLDDLTTQKEVLEAQLESVLANRAALDDKRKQIDAAIQITQLNLKDSHVTAPVNGTILNRYHNLKELVNPGMVLFDMADVSVMDATIYIPLSELNRVRLNQKVSVKVDGISNNLEGTVYWIASEAEFTPKTILTEETRTSLVYAVKIRINNTDGKLKIGMPVDVLIEQEG